MPCETQPTRKGPISYPCVACGSMVSFDQVYCEECLKAIRYGVPRPDGFMERILAEIERDDQVDPDADLERDWLRRQIERAA
jgi:hypothetical protein